MHSPTITHHEFPLTIKLRAHVAHGVSMPAMNLSSANMAKKVIISLSKYKRYVYEIY